jgi:dolichol-phosphate mannosyltransferase
MENVNLQIIVPIFNEGENVVLLYNELQKFAIPFTSARFVYDLDSDTSLPFLAKLHEQDSRVVAYKNQLGRGVINALRYAFSNVESGPVAVIMGDMSDDISIFPQMLQLWKDGAIIVSPSRYMSGGKQIGGGFIKKILSTAAGISLNILGLPTADPTNNFKIYDGAWLKEQQIESKAGFEIALELVYKAHLQQQIIKQLPSTWRDRTQGESKFDLKKWLPHYLHWYWLCLKLLVSRLSFFSCCYSNSK